MSFVLRRGKCLADDVNVIDATLLTARSRSDRPCLQAEGCLQYQRKRTSGGFAINVTLPSRAIFDIPRHRERARRTERMHNIAELQLSARHTICI